MKRSFVWFVLCGVLLFSTGCSQPFRVGLVTETGSIDDKGFNSAAWKGVQAAAKTLGLKEGTQVKYIETGSADDYEKNIEKLVSEGFQVIVTVGFLMAEATLNAAKKYPEIRFIGVDQFRANNDEAKNYVGLIFRETHAGYLAGVLAASLSKTGKVAGVFGPNNVPPVVGFKHGFEQGAKSVNANIEVFAEYHPQGENAFNNPTWGAKTAVGFIAKGADVVFAAGGKTGNGALEATAGERQGGKELWCIGVDVDQWDTVTASQPCLVSSALKKIDVSLAALIQKAKEEAFPTEPNFIGQVGLAPFHSFDATLPSGLKDTLNSTQTKLEGGSIQVTSDPSKP